MTAIEAGMFAANNRADRHCIKSGSPALIAALNAEQPFAAFDPRSVFDTMSASIPLRDRKLPKNRIIFEVPCLRSALADFCATLSTARGRFK